VGDVTNSIDVTAGKVTQLGFVVVGGQTLVHVADSPRDGYDLHRTEIKIIPGDLFVYSADITARAQ
jgi:hypothetical protein